MAEPTGTPSVWIGQEVHLEYAVADDIRTDNCTLEGVNDRGVYVSEGESSYFYPWNNILRIRLGPKPAKGTRKMRVY